jgi:hypothetical protein
MFGILVDVASILLLAVIAGVNDNVIMGSESATTASADNIRGVDFEKKLITLLWPD